MSALLGLQNDFGEAHIWIMDLYTTFPIYGLIGKLDVIS